jgi:hypothetical protein
LLLAAFALFGLACIGVTEQAHASCGDWLDHAAMSENGSPADSATQGKASSDGSSERRSPCRGPHCSRGPVQPLLPPTPIEITSSSGPKAGIPAFAAVDLELSKQVALWLSPAATPLCGYPASIDRPPRG